MSTSNMICIQHRLDGWWWVWMDFASVDIHEPEKSDNLFHTYKEAYDYAAEWIQKEALIGYKITVLDYPVTLKNEE